MTNLLTGRRAILLLAVAGAGVLLLALYLTLGRAPAPAAGPPAEPEPPDLSVLRSLPYVSYVPVREGEESKAGVTLYDRKRASPGLNLYVSRPRAEARLIDMEGRLLRVWRSDAAQPDAAERDLVEFLEGWHHVEPAGDGGIFAIVENAALLRLDSRGDLVWQAPVHAHHDVATAADAAVLTLSAEVKEVQVAGRTVPVLDEHVVVLDSDGAVRSRLALLDLLAADPRTAPIVRAAFDRALPVVTASAAIARGREAGRNRPEAERIRIEARYAALAQILEGRFEGSERVRIGALRNTPGDLLHANSVELLDEHPAGVWRRGDLLLCLRNLDLIVVVDPESRRIRWAWGTGVLEKPHQPSALPNGHVIVFDNGTRSRRSRIVEVDPTSGEVVWSWQAEPPGSFFSPTRGGVEPLPNGDILITDSDSGRAFEITREGERVWEFLNPDLDPGHRRRAAVYRVARVDPSLFP